MATSTRVRSRSAAAEREHHRTNLWAQLARFAGLFLSPVLGLVCALLVHLWVSGIDLHWGPINWEVRTSPAAVTVAVCLITLVTVGTAYLAHQFAEHRKPALRNALAGSVVVVGVLFAVNVGTGLHYWWSGLLLIGGWTVAVIWSIARLDVTRNDKQAEATAGPQWLESIKNWRGKARRVLDDKGRVIATEIDFEHADGGTVDDLQDLVPAIESESGSPAGLSSASGGDRADRSTARIMHIDPLAAPVPMSPPSSPGGSIAEPLVVGTYSNAERVRMMVAGKPHAQLVSSVLWMGMTGAGKTTAENKALTEMQTRRDVVIFYANKAKGMQDIRPVIPGIEVAVIADEVDQGALYREAMKQLTRILTYRSNQLGLFGISEWTAETCFHSPPWRTDENGQRVRMEPMPLLFAHFGEADAILEEDSRGSSTYLASKGRSVGIATSWSLQRADYQKMPTGLRYNLGTALCFGLGDEDSAEFALPKHVIKAGAHPDQWRNRKPGYFYFVGQGIDERLFPVFARSEGVGPNGEKLPEAMLAQNLQWAPRMTKLDAGSVAATDYSRDGKQGNWWRDCAAETDHLRDLLLRGGTANRTATAGPQTSQVAVDEDDDETDRETRKEMEEEMRNTTHVEGVELYPSDDDGPAATMADARKEHTPAPEGDQLSWEPTQPAPRDRQAALAELRRALIEMHRSGQFTDRADRSGRTSLLTPTQIRQHYKFRSRPFFAEALRDISTGAEDGPQGFVLSRREGGGFLLQEVPSGDAA